MLHYIFACAIMVHTFIHLMGFAKELKFAEAEEEFRANEIVLSAGTRKVLDILWLVAYGLFLLSVILYMSFISSWLIPAAAGVLLSQALIIVDWREAKYGTITNIIILLVILSYCNNLQF